jgi:hypothetical protein
MLAFVRAEASSRHPPDATVKSLVQERPGGISPYQVVPDAMCPHQADELRSVLERLEERTGAARGRC